MEHITRGAAIHRLVLSFWHFLSRWLLTPPIWITGGTGLSFENEQQSVGLWHRRHYSTVTKSPKL